MPAPPGPYGIFSAVQGACRNLAAPLVGIVIDRAFPGSGISFVTDGTWIARLVPGGALAPPTFYSPSSCYLTPTFPGFVGLGFAARQIELDAFGPMGPRIGAKGQSWIGNPDYEVRLTGAPSGATAILKGSFESACQWTSLHRPIYLAAPSFTLTIQPVSSEGKARFATPIPASVPPGITVHLQWAALKPGAQPPIQLSPAGVFTTCMP